jgi:hypothetical protein
MPASALTLLSGSWFEVWEHITCATVPEELALARFLRFFSRKWHFFGQRELQRKVVLLWGGPTSALQPRKISRKERKYRENIAKKNGKKIGVTAQLL